MSKEVNNKNEKGKVSYYLILASIFVVVFSCGFVVCDLVSNSMYHKSNDKNSEKVGSDENKSINLDVNSRLVKRLYNMVYDERYGKSTSWIYPKQEKILVSELSSEARLALVFSNIDYSDMKYAYNVCSSNPTINISGKEYVCNDKGSYTIINKTVVDRVYKELFGSNAVISEQENYMFTDISKGNVYVKSAGDYWVLYTTIAGNIGAYNTQRTITKAVQTDKELKIYETIVITDPESKSTKEEVIYTFKLEDDGMYTYYSREEK